MKKPKLIYKIKALEKRIIQRFINSTNLSKNEFCHIPKPTPTQMQIMEYLMTHVNEDVYQRDLEDVLNLKRATVSGVLQTMEKNNLIERTIDDKDTRTKKIILNEETKEIFIRNKKKLDEIESIITKNISEKELETFSLVIDKMIENMKTDALQKKGDE